MSLRYGALYIPATESTTKETTASLAVAPSITTSDTAEVSTTASVNVTPATTASGVRVVDTTAALTVAPATAAEGERVAGFVTHETTASLTVALDLAASATGDKSTSASLDPTPSTSATATREQSTTATLDASPTTTATATRSADTTASLAVSPTVTAEATAWRVWANDGTGMVDQSGTWTDDANAYDDNATTYATATGVGVHTLDITGYGVGDVVGSEDTLVSVVLSVSQFVSDGGRFAAPTVQPYVGASPIGSPIALLERTTAGSEDVSLSVTLAQLRDPDFKVRFSVEQTS